MANTSRTRFVFELLSRVALALSLGVAAASASAATGEASLRWHPSASPEVTGYVVHVGNESGFFAEGVAVAEIDVGLDFNLEGGIAHYPLSGLISQSAWVVMTAYAPGGLESPASNEIFAEIPVSCASDADCDDGDLCNGAETCSGGTCSGGTAPVCVSAGACSIASCDPLAGCSEEAARDGLWCDDGDPETFADVCIAGSCSGEVSSDVNSEPFHVEDFEANTPGSDPIGWLDTAAGSFDQIADDFHVVEMSDGNHVMQTASRATNIHSHLMDGRSADWYGYEFSGRMRIDASSGGIGVTLYSDFPNSDTYYRLRRYDRNSFHLAPHPDGHDTCVGKTDTNVRPGANEWYAFRFRAYPEDGGTRVQAKVWEAQTAEPASWQADCFDPIASALRGGAPGVWSMGPGTKSWDDLAISYVSDATEPEPEPECVIDSDCGDGDACNGAERCVDGSCAAAEPLVCTGSQQCSFTTCDPALGCVVEHRPNGQACDDQNRCTEQDRCQAGVCTAGAALSCPTPGECQAGSCDPLVGCKLENLPDGSQCNDGDPSTVNDVCRLGGCSGEPEPECVTDAECGDGNVCNGAESCQAGVCTAGAALSCSAPGECQAGSCDRLVGCTLENLPDGSQCNDGDPSTANDVCRLGSCSGESEPATSAFFEDFERYAPGEDPEGWFDTGASNSLDEEPRGFEVMELADGSRAFGTNSTAVNIHSHYVADESPHWTEYEYRGRMRIGWGSGGIGVTLYSDYPNSDSYYRLRRYGSGTFHLAPHPEEVVSCVGSTDTGVRPAANTWYHFRFQAFAEGDGTRLRAKLWSAAESEPEIWRVDCLTTGFGTFYSGSPGVWSMGPGAKHWDDLEVVGLSDAGPVDPDPVPPVDPGVDAIYSEDFEAYPDGSNADGWLDTRAKNSLIEEPGLFSVAEQSDGNRALATASGPENIHSHLIAGGSEAWSDYEFSGRMQLTNAAGGIGVTLYSDYPNSDSYYRLRRYRGTTFHLAPHPEAENDCSGRTSTAVMPHENVWYRFRFQAFAAGAASRLRAKVWPEPADEPGSWQIDCAVDDSIAVRAGRPGVWSTSHGMKLWDDLEVRPIP